jgi:Zn-dependent peptidase ImmA (M78 family)
MEANEMVIIRKKRFAESGRQSTLSIDLIDNADKLLAYAKQQEIKSFPLDVESVARALKIDINYSPLDNDLSGILRLVDSDNVKKWELIVNSTHHPNRQRYTIAHELGHFCLHRYAVKEFKDRIFFRATSSNPMEWEANDFAGQILMPEEDFKSLVRRGITSVDELAKEFRVSSLALRIRAKQLGFSGHGL